MVIKIDEYSDVPIYMQIRNQIVIGISNGELAPGEQLPTVRALALEMGINTMTVSKVYQLLKSEGKSGVLSDENKTELKRIVSEARLSGVSKKDILKLIEEYY